jgi:D-galactose 1-dehydrogenase
MTCKIGIVGFGKIARDAHVPAINANPDFELVAVASRNAQLPGTDHFTTLDEMLAGRADLDAVALCTPPQVRHAQARAALAAGKHVLLEKPPGATLSGVADLKTRATQAQCTLFASWHSRFAPAVEPARAWLAERRITAVAIQWQEDVRIWHPGQEWIWQPGGLGVFDPGINALSIATRILPRPFFLTAAALSFPENRDAPIAAELSFTDEDNARIAATFDWRQSGPQTWDIHVETDADRLTLTDGGARMRVDDQVVVDEPAAEYAGLYAHFATLIGQYRSDVDVSPLRHVADAFMRARRYCVAPFE